MRVNLDRVRELDRQDPLAIFKERFALPEGVLYLDGNSLGAQPLAARDAVAETLDQWRDELIKGWIRDGSMRRNGSATGLPGAGGGGGRGDRHR